MLVIDTSVLIIYLMRFVLKRLSYTVKRPVRQANSDLF